MSENTPGTPAGWYPDPQHPGQQRYWDGTSWAAPTAPPPAPGAAPPVAATPPTSTNAIVGLVLAIASWLVCPLIASIAALFVARSSDREIAASGGRVSGSGLNTATRIIAWINIGASIIAIIVFGILAILGIGMFAQVASSVNPDVNSQTGLADGRYVMDPTGSIVINDACTFSGTVFTLDNATVKEATVYGKGKAQCGLGGATEVVYFEVRGGVARILEVK